MQITSYILLLAYLHTHTLARPVTGDVLGSSEGSAGSNPLSAQLRGDSTSDHTPGTWSRPATGDTLGTTVNNNGGRSGEGSVNQGAGGATTDPTLHANAESQPGIENLPYDSRGTANPVGLGADLDTASGQPSSSGSTGETGDSGGADSLNPRPGQPRPANQGAAQHGAGIGGDSGYAGGDEGPQHLGGSMAGESTQAGAGVAADQGTQESTGSTRDPATQESTGSNPDSGTQASNDGDESRGGSGPAGDTNDHGSGAGGGARIGRGGRGR